MRAIRTIMSHRSFSNVEFRDLDKPFCCLQRGGLTPGQTLQPNDLSSAMETSTNLVAFVSAQKKMPQINLALGIHLLLRLKTSSKLAKQQGAHGASCKNFGS